jgi:hypothetical protein
MQKVNGKQYPAKYVTLSIAPTSRPSSLMQSNTDGSGMYAVTVAPGTYTLSIKNPKGGTLRYSITATTGKYSIIKPIVLPN